MTSFFDLVFTFALLSKTGEEHSVSHEESLRFQSVWETRCEQLANLKQLNCSALLRHISSLPLFSLLPVGSNADDEVELGVEEAPEQRVEPGEEVTGERGGGSVSRRELKVGGWTQPVLHSLRLVQPFARLLLLHLPTGKVSQLGGEKVADKA